MIVIELKGEVLDMAKEIADKYGFENPHQFVVVAIRLVSAWERGQSSCNLSHECQEEMQRYTDWELQRYEDA